MLLKYRFYCCALLWPLLLHPLAAQNVITTIAGVDAVFTGDGQPATSVPIGYPNGVATDAAGNVYIIDSLEHLILRVSPDGTLNVIAGNGIAGHSGDGGRATAAAIAPTDNPNQYVGALFQDSMGGIAVDKAGNVYFADGPYLRRIATDGTISTLAGGGTSVPGNGGPATKAALGIIAGVALDGAGNVFFSETNRIRKLTPDGILNTYAGTGANGFSGDNGPAIAAQLSQPLGLAFDAQGNLYFADGDIAHVSRVRKITTSGTISTVAGGGSKFPADNLNPLSLDITGASGVAVDALGAVYVFGPYNGYLLKFNGGFTTLITSPVFAVFTNNIAARNSFVSGSRLYDNSSIALDAAGNLFVADSHNTLIRKIDTQGIISVVAGNGQYGFGGDGGPALGANIQGPSHMTQTPDGTIYFLDTLNARVRAISPSGIIRSVLSNANFPMLGGLTALTSDAGGNLYVLALRRLLKVAPDGSITILVNQPGFTVDSGDGGLATQAGLASTGGLARDADGNIYISDTDANRIRKVTLDGKIQTIAGNGKYGISPDGTFAATASIAQPSTLLLDNLGGLYFEETPGALGTSTIRYIQPDGRLRTIAGNGQGGFSGDGGPATQAGMMMQERTGLAFDKNGFLYIADGFNSRVRRIGALGNISTFAGSGNAISDGDGGDAKPASFITPRGLFFDSKGDLLISDVAAGRIRAVLATTPSISVTPTQLSFSGKAGGAQTPPQKLTFASSVSGLFFNVAKSAGAPWLLLGSGAGYTPRLISVRCDPSNLTPGTYQATFTVTPRLTNAIPSTIPVTCQVAPGDVPKLSIDKTAFSFTFPRNSTTPRNQVVRVDNAGSGALPFTAKAQTKTGGGWLSISPLSGSSTPQNPVHVSITADPTNLAVGTYTGTVTINSSASGEMATVLVTLTVSPLDQAIQLSHAALSFTAVVNGSVVAPHNFAVMNIGRGTMNFTVATRTLSGGPWLSATPKSGAATNGVNTPTITVSINQAGLGPGIYYGLVRIDSAAAANTPRLVTVVLRVLPADADPGPDIEPSELVFTAVQGATSPGSKNLLIYNVSGTPQTYVSSIVASDPNDLFNFVPDNATLSLTAPTKLVMQPITTGLAPGVYEAELTLQFSDGYIQRAVIRTIVTPAPPGSSNTPFEGRDTTACTPTQLVPVVTTLGQAFGIPATWPVSVEAEVHDDCGNTLENGSVKVSFSNGDVPLSLQVLPGGFWHTTWLSGQAAGPVTLTLTATDPARNLTGTREVTGGLGDPSGAPILGAAVSAASNSASTPLAPLSIISLYGQDLADSSYMLAPALPLGTTLAGASVVMAGNLLPLIFAANGQINAVVSTGINTNTNHQILVQRDNTISIPISVDVAPAEPAIFGYPLPGDPPTQGAVVNAITGVVTHPGTPATAGDILAIYCTGLGAVDQNLADGAGAPSSPLANTATLPIVTIGGKDAKVAFSGLAPTYVGLYQIDATVPPGVTPGNQVPIVISIAGQTSPTSPPVTIAVK